MIAAPFGGTVDFSTTDTRNSDKQARRGAFRQAKPGVNMNTLSPTDTNSFDPVGEMGPLTGIEVEVEVSVCLAECGATLGGLPAGFSQDRVNRLVGSVRRCLARIRFELRFG